MTIAAPPDHVWTTAQLTESLRARSGLAGDAEVVGGAAGGKAIIVLNPASRR
ncbi:hypothetical protein LWC35_03480 [Pseudonocardia kujensis]|uniref:hypothetical protein n=1 Tax=Pseudonocardia kujensis TaxID=1128675 RepID=UPI001E43DF49|nr:hypothetical protein [Pseudonocardia kujensis]MCE0761978.1 hypothetical protein [Pseudonocardia kujensis]